MTAREFHARACACNSLVTLDRIALGSPGLSDMHPAGTAVGLSTMMGQQLDEQPEQREAPHRAHHPPPLTHYRHPNAATARSKPTHFLSLRCRGAVEGAVMRVQQVSSSKGLALGNPSHPASSSSPYLRCRGAVEGAVTRVQQVSRWGSA